MALSSTVTTAPTTPVIGVVVVSFNSATLLADCLHSVQQCTLPLRIIVVDNASTDESVAVVRLRFPDVTLHAMGYNSGFATATNAGIRLFGSTLPPYVLLLNPDTVVQPGAIETLVAFLQHHPRVGVASPRLLNPDGTVQAAAFRFPTLSMSILDVFPPGEVLPGRLYGSWWHGRYPQERAEPPVPFAIDHPLGACMLVRRDVLKQVGLLDERYFMYCEEIEWCWRVRQAGWARWQVPAAQVIHVGGASTRYFRHRMLVALHTSRTRFFQQHYSATFCQWHRIITRAGMLRAVLRAWYAYSRRTQSRDTLRAQLWAYGEITRILPTSE